MFQGICPIKDIKRPKVPFPCFFIDYGSKIPEIKGSPVSTRTHAINLLVESVTAPWILFFSPKVRIIEKNLPKLANDVDLIWSKGYYGNKEIDFGPLYYAVFVKKNKFPILDNELSESEAFLKLFNQLKGLKNREVFPPYWSVIE